MTPTTLLFDLDGTLVDSSADLAAALNHVLKQEGHEPLPVDDVAALLGDGAGVLLARGFEQRGATAPQDALERFRNAYDDGCLVHTRPYPGIPELLAELRARSPRPAVSVVTNKPTPFAEKVVRGLGLDAWVDDVVGPELVAQRKPAAEHVLGALRRLGRDTDEHRDGIVMIGDGTTDVLAGRAAGARAVAVLWGYRSRAELEACDPHDVAADVGELRAILRSR